MAKSLVYLLCVLALVIGVVVADRLVSVGQQSPLDKLSVLRTCGFLDISNSIWAACDDGTVWRVVEMPAPPAIETQTEAEDSTALTPIRYSYYWPPLGGPNCSRFVGGKCISKMANGEPWEDFVGEAVACPPQWGFGTTIELDGNVWTCRDRGGMVVFEDGIPWVDFLRPDAAYLYGTILMVQVSQIDG